MIYLKGVSFEEDGSKYLLISTVALISLFGLVGTVICYVTDKQEHKGSSLAVTLPEAKKPKDPLVQEVSTTLNETYSLTAFRKVNLELYKTLSSTSHFVHCFI